MPKRQWSELRGAARSAPLPAPALPRHLAAPANARRRKIARLLLFANLVPLEPVEQAAAAAPASPKVCEGCLLGRAFLPAGAPARPLLGSAPCQAGMAVRARAAVPAPPQPGTASYMRRLWRSPDSGQPTEVQLILGATLGRNMGR